MWWKLLTKCITHIFFDGPKSSFGRHKILEKAGLSKMGWVADGWTSHLFFDDIHFEHFDKSNNYESRLTLLSKCSKWRLSKCSKWRLSKNRWLVADGWSMCDICFCILLARKLQHASSSHRPTHWRTRVIDAAIFQMLDWPVSFLSSFQSSKYVWMQVC